MNVELDISTPRRIEWLLSILPDYKAILRAEMDEYKAEDGVVHMSKPPTTFSNSVAALMENVKKEGETNPITPLPTGFQEWKLL